MKQKMILIFIITPFFIILLGYLATKSYVISDYSDFLRGMATGIIGGIILIWITAFILSVFRKSEKESEQIQWMPKNQMLLSAGMICMFTGSLMAVNNEDNVIILFLSVIVFILSMIFNIIYIRRIRKYKSQFDLQINTNNFD